jgi:hypothetical protein
MRKFFTIFAFVAVLSLAGTASAGIHQCPDGSWHTNCGNHQLPPEPTPVPTPETPGNTNTNTNTNTAGGGSSNVDIGNGLGNFSPTAFAGGGDATAGANSSSTSSSTSSTSTNTSTSTHQGQGQGQGQMQGQVGIVRDGDVSVDSNDTVQVDASDNSVHSIDNDFPVNTAAPVFAGNCSQGVSAQTQGFGGSIASGNSVCDFIAVAGAFIAGGDRDNAFRVLGKAEEAADWRFFFTKIRMVITLGLL